MHDAAAARLQELALDLLHVAARDHHRTHQPHCDRALAHTIRASLRVGITWRTVIAATGMSQDDATECMDRWAGDN